MGFRLVRPYFPHMLDPRRLLVTSSIVFVTSPSAFRAYPFIILHHLVPVEVAKLEKAERRYAWIKRELRAKEDVWAIFPHSWRVPYLLCMQFCKVTR